MQPRSNYIMENTKIVIIIDEDLLTWQKMNVTAFLMSGIATQDIIGDPYVDASGIEYLPMSGQPVMIYSSEREVIKDILKKGLNKDVVISIFTQELFQTFNDADNRKSVSLFKTDDLNLAGIAMCGKKNHIDRMTKGLSFHK